MTTTATPFPRVNVALLRDAQAHIEADPQHWDQRAWASRTPCGTTYCLAGWACVLAGHDIDWDNAVYANNTDTAPLDALTLIDGRLIEDTAQELLGLTNPEADELFDGHNTLPKLRRIIADLTEAGAEHDGRPA